MQLNPAVYTPGDTRGTDARRLFAADRHRQREPAAPGSRVDLQRDAAHAEQAVLARLHRHQQLHAVESRRQLRRRGDPVQRVQPRQEGSAGVGSADAGPYASLHDVVGVGSARRQHDRAAEVGARRLAVVRRDGVRERAAVQRHQRIGPIAARAWQQQRPRQAHRVNRSRRRPVRIATLWFNPAAFAVADVGTFGDVPEGVSARAVVPQLEHGAVQELPLQQRS